MTQLSEFIRKQTPVPGYLPLIHITNTYSFRAISLEAILKPTQCNFFHKDILYLFYGRPSYRVKDTLNGNISFDWPVVFVLDEAKIASRIDSIFPFDTGGFFINKYRRFFDPRSSIDDFRLEASIDDARRVISAFYQSNYEYFCGSSRKNVEISIDELEAIGLHEMARQPADPLSKSATPADERASAIELHLTCPIDLKDTLKGIVFPQRFYDVPDWTKAIDSWSPEYVDTYSVINGPSPDFFAGVVYTKTEQMLRQMGYLS